MIATFVHVWVKHEYREAFIEACRVNHEASIREEGNLRFDILQDSDDQQKFVLYEAYVSEESARAHKDTPHYLAWREKVAPMMDKPREGHKHLILYPEK